MVFGVLGAGSWGTAVARLLGEREEVYLWGRDRTRMKNIQVDRVNETYLPDVRLPYEVRATYDFEHVVEDSDVLVLAVPSRAVSGVLEKLSPSARRFEAVVNLAKGFDPDSGRRLSRVYRERAGGLGDYYLLTGPSHAREIAEKRPASAVIGGGTEEGRERLQRIFYRDYFRVYTNPDLVGLEMGGALKNVMAIAAGISDGLNFGHNARAALLTRGMHELRRLAVNEGASPATLYGLSGLGDLIVTATSDLSRNYRLGVQLGEGLPLEKARTSIDQVVEGIPATRIAHRKSEEAGVRTPLVDQVHAVLFEQRDPLEAVEQLMTRRSRPEFSAETDAY